MTNSLPVMHVQPENGWLNDPNGLVFHGGRWHVFYQANPAETKHDNISWGHVSSSDLVTWSQHPSAFSPQSGQPDTMGAWSGVYFPWLDKPAVVYTAIDDTPVTSTVVIREALDDDLVAWSDPCVVAQTPESVSEMRDPFCFDWRGRRLALLGARLEDDVPAVLLWDVSNAHTWRYLGVWARGDELPFDAPASHFWECPQLVVDGDQAALIVSLWVDGETVAVGYLSGHLNEGFYGDDSLPCFTPERWGWVDTGDVFYAPQIMKNPLTDAEGDYVMFGWVREPNHEAAAQAGVQGCLTLPRRIHLEDGRVMSAVMPQLETWADPLPGTVRAVGILEEIELPLCGRTRMLSPNVTIHGVERAFDVQCATGELEIWTDGEVIEVYGDEQSPHTVRQSGTRTWTLTSAWPTTVHIWAKC